MLAFERNVSRYRYDTGFAPHIFELGVDGAGKDLSAMTA